MPLTYVQHKTLSLKNHPEFDEAWLQSKIADEPSILGLGDVAMIERERSQGKAGRLDLLLWNPDENVRYEVELMLGPTDPSHIIRTIEYWDIERRRYPAYEHVAVMVAEAVTARFLNVLALFSGSIPLIAIQLNALQVGENIVLDFVRVLDQTDLRVDDEEEAAAKAPADRAYWEARSKSDVLKVLDRVHDMLKGHADGGQSLNYNRRFIGLTDGQRSRNFLLFLPRKAHLRVGAVVDAKDDWVARLEEAGLAATAKSKRVWVNLTDALLSEHGDLIGELVRTAATESKAQ
jgi:hypothetical protein